VRGWFCDCATGEEQQWVRERGEEDGGNGEAEVGGVSWAWSRSWGVEKC
jgi:hypothetical protein